MMLFSVYHNVDIALKDNDDKVVSRSSGWGISDVVASFYLAGEYIAVDVSDSFYSLLSEEYRGFNGLFVHLCCF